MAGFKVITPPAAEPVTLHEIKGYLRLDVADSTFDEDLVPLIEAARNEAENFQNRAFMKRTYDLAFDTFPTMPLKLPMPPLASVTSISCIDDNGETIGIPTSDFIIDQFSEPGRIAFKSGRSWPNVSLQTLNGVVVRFVAGNDSPPENVKLAIKLFVGHRFENPESEDVPSTFYNLLWGDRVVPV